MESRVGLPLGRYRENRVRPTHAEYLARAYRKLEPGTVTAPGCKRQARAASLRWLAAAREFSSGRQRRTSPAETSLSHSPQPHPGQADVLDGHGALSTAARKEVKPLCELSASQPRVS